VLSRLTLSNINGSYELGLAVGVYSDFANHFKFTVTRKQRIKDDEIFENSHYFRRNQDNHHKRQHKVNKSAVGQYFL
jgi:hypothetical protein